MFKFSMISLCLFCVIATSTYAQTNYFKYHKMVQKAESYLIDSAFQKAVKTYKKAYQKFDKTFVRDDINAMVCALICNDYKSALFFDKRRVQKNTPLPPLMEAEWKKYQASEVYLEASKELDSLKQYGEQVRKNGQLVFLYDSLAKKDQEVRKNPVYINDKDTAILNTDSLNIIAYTKLMTVSGYPSDVERGKSQPYDIILRHNTQYYKGTLLPLVYEEVKKGNFDVYQYHQQYDGWYMHNKAPKPDDREIRLTHFLTATHFGGVWAIVDNKLYQLKHSKEDLKRINGNRKTIGLGTLEQAYRTQFFSTRDKRFLLQHVIMAMGHPVKGTVVEKIFANILPKYFELVPLHLVGKEYINYKGLIK